MPEATSAATLRVGRSPVFATGGVAATSQPLGAGAAVQILREGGNALEAAIACAAALNAVEPSSTGVGGDMFMIYWDAGEKKLAALNGSGRSPRKATRERYRSEGFEEMPRTGIFSVTTPGAVDGWCTALERFGTGKKSLADLLAPAIHYAEKGFPVSPNVADAWTANEEKLRACPASVKTYLPDNRPLRRGEVFRNPALAKTLRLIAKGGREVFYEGPIARAIVEASREAGGLFEMEDFAGTKSKWVEPIHTNYRGYDLHELPPNNQGLTALICLNILEGFPIGEFSYGCAEHLHLMIEAMRLAFADRNKYIADPDMAEVPVAGLISKEYAAERRKLIRPDSAGAYAPGVPSRGDNTVYLTVADGEGNMCSFINSLFNGFGSGVTAGDTGIVLQNRGYGFVLEEGHANCIAPGKRPFHTLVPAFVLKEGEPWMCFGARGGHMQTQAHVQVLSNMVDFGMDIQEAIDAPRFRIYDDRDVEVENGVPDEVLDRLRSWGHGAFRSKDSKAMGGAQGIVCLPKGVYMAGSDHRKDGCAMGF